MMAMKRPIDKGHKKTNGLITSFTEMFVHSCFKTIKLCFFDGPGVHFCPGIIWLILDLKTLLPHIPSSLGPTQYKQNSLGCLFN